MAEGHVLVEATGTEDGRSAPFTASGNVRLTWEVSGQSHSGIEPRAGFYLYRDGVDGHLTAVAAQHGDGSATRVLPSGRYVIRVLATPWTRWRVRVTVA